MSTARGFMRAAGAVSFIVRGGQHIYAGLNRRLHLSPVDAAESPPAFNEEAFLV
jgi:hypothetical protein